MSLAKFDLFIWAFGREHVIIYNLYADRISSHYIFRKRNKYRKDQRTFPFLWNKESKLFIFILQYTIWPEWRHLNAKDSIQIWVQNSVSTLNVVKNTWKKHELTLKSSLKGKEKEKLKFLQCSNIKTCLSSTSQQFYCMLEAGSFQRLGKIRTMDMTWNWNTFGFSKYERYKTTRRAF